MPEETVYLLMDANVLIDYLAVDLSILSLVDQHLGKVYLLTTILAEVDGLDENICEAHSLTVVEPTFAQLSKAGSRVGQLSFEDQTCLWACVDNGWTCVTSDRLLRTKCLEQGVSTKWGLQIMAGLVDLGKLDKNKAWEVAKGIQAQNSFMTEKLLARFKIKIGIDE